jgi:Holliday junction DNA helicase RuvA
MIDYIKGEIIELTPTDMVVECYGIGYSILISVQTYSALEGKKNATVYIHHYLREDEELYYGFATKDERSMFRLLIGVSGVGAATARMMLSSLTVEEIQNAILSEDVNRIKSVKGIGLKTAQRIIVDLKDKIKNVAAVGGKQPLTSSLATNNDTIESAISALVMLGFQKSASEKVVKSLLKDMPDIQVEEAVRQALRRL